MVLSPSSLLSRAILFKLVLLGSGRLWEAGSLWIKELRSYVNSMVGLKACDVSPAIAYLYSMVPENRYRRIIRLSFPRRASLTEVYGWMTECEKASD
ncbi:hypothetical protein K503DRAFT_770605 [Rhizopogon vinicolor AM-OR11-026]|uniref:Uncharacterized protein n=1 Tax=Rhizopogon vinicolor AM-OR11-026 TaxID=1314800 RepID=A0A1B7N0H3_9AGAM|nr:hypothetical protein K503DRAFT_770605 [Rhizopogon vinicolor AM-OR11-026]